MALSQREKRLLLVPVLLGGVVLFYTYVHEPLFTRRAEAAQTSQKTALDLKRDQQKLAKEGNLQVRLEAVAAREQVIDAWVPGKNSAALLIWYLSQAETATGARVTGITVGDRMQMTASEARGAASGQAPAQPSGQPSGQPQGGAQAPAQPGPAPAAPDPSLMVINLDLKVEARFLQHLHFNQALEEMPLFLNTDGIALVPGKNEETLALVGELVASGNAELAAQVLGGSPNLEGSYRIALIFKGEKKGPTTDPMAFSQGTGRPDPFALDAVDEFVEVLRQYYAAPRDAGEQSGQGSKKPTTSAPGTKKGQMG